MTEEEIMEGNIQIVLFLKRDKAFDSRDNIYHYYDEWSHLMPVVEKICRLRIDDGIKYVDYSYLRTFGMLNKETGQIMIRLNGYPLHESDTLIEACWLAVVEYCKHYNEKNHDTTGD